MWHRVVISPTEWTMAVGPRVAAMGADEVGMLLGFHITPPQGKTEPSGLSGGEYRRARELSTTPPVPAHGGYGYRKRL